VDDEEETRTLLRAFLEAEDIEVVAEANGGIEGVFKAGELRPDVVLMDVRMPDMNGIEATRQIRAVHRGVQVIILTFYGAEEWDVAAEEIGAFGYLVKGCPPAQIVEQIRLATASEEDSWSPDEVR
jgi:DNA-binding NarL/FixJ family response regulator